MRFRALTTGVCFLALYSPLAAQSDAAAWLSRAEQYFQAQDWAHSAEAARQALRQNPRFVGALVILALAETSQSKIADAEQHLRAAATLAPADPRVLSYLGSTLLRQQKLPEAKAAFEKVMRVDPENAVAPYNLGLIAMARKNSAEAERWFERALAHDASDVPARMGLLECQLALQKQPAALENVRAIDSLLAAGDPERLRLAATLTQYRQFDAAVAALEKLRESLPNVYGVHYALALANLGAGRLQAAADNAARAVQIQPEPAAYYLLATIEERQSSPADAMVHYGQASTLAPRQEDYRADYASFVLEHGKPADAVALWAAASRDFPQSWRMLMGWGAALYLTGDAEASAGKLLDAVKLNPGAAPLYGLLGQLYELAPDKRPAIQQVFADYLKRKPRDASALLGYGRMQYLVAKLSNKADYSAAKHTLEQAVALNPHLAEASLQLGIIAQDEGRLQQSAGLLQQALRDDPNLPDAHYRLGLTYRRLNMAEESKSEMALFAKLKADARESIARQTRAGAH